MTINWPAKIFNFLPGNDSDIAWEKFASTIGATFIARDPWRQNSSKICLHNKNVITLDTFFINNGEVSNSVTRARSNFLSDERFRFEIYRRSAMNIFYETPWSFLDKSLDESLSNERFIVKTNDIVRASALLDVVMKCNQQWSNRWWTLLEIGAKLKIDCRDDNNHELLFTAPYVFKNPEHLAAIFDLMKVSLSTLQEIDTS